MSMQRLFAAACLSSLAGCVFMPNGDHAARAPESVTVNPEAPRLEPLETRRFDLESAQQELIGAAQVLFARHENTLPGIARTYDLGYEELRYANPGVDVWLPGEGTPIYLPTASLLPDTPRVGIVINVASMRLLRYATYRETTATEVIDRISVTSHPIGVGREGWATPVGEAKVTQKARSPVWYPPASVRAEHAAAGDPLPAVVPAGPDNPLGDFALALSLPGYLIHGTNKPSGVGMRVSHGCIRLYPEDIAALFESVSTGTPVRIVDEPALAGWRDGELYLEVHPLFSEDQRNLETLARRAIEAALERAQRPDAPVDEAAVARVVAQRRGMPFPVLERSASIEQYLARARVVENVAPVVDVEATARAD